MNTVNEFFGPRKGTKVPYLKDNDTTLEFREGGKLVAAYIPGICVSEKTLTGLNSINFTRVIYISPYKKINTTPRLTWAYGVVEPDDNFRRDSKKSQPIVSYHNLNFVPEAMPEWLNDLAVHCRDLAKDIAGFDPGYNSCIIGKYEDGEDCIGFHTDAETFLATKFCANVTVGAERDFHFKIEGMTHGITLADKSLFFFDSVEHALPKRKKLFKGPSAVRYSISFRNMKNDIGIGNSYYYCRGLAGAIDDDVKTAYIQKMEDIKNK